MNIIPFNKPYITGQEELYIKEAISNTKLSGDGAFTKKCHSFLETRYNFRKVLLTTSCTDAIEMAAILSEIQPGDEVIVPSFTFVSTANPFLLRGARIVFADSEEATPNIDVSKIEQLITPRTRAIVPVHYAGVACEMDALMNLAQKHDLIVIEDAAHSIDSFYKGRPLGGIGHLGTFSFHETKNIISGEGGCLSINDEKYLSRSEIVREKGTNRAQFFRGEVDKYGWVDIGSSFLPSELVAAFLLAQLESLDEIQKRRVAIWERYYSSLGVLSSKCPNLLPVIPDYAYNNAHMFYLQCNSLEERSELLNFLSNNSIKATFHYISLHTSKYFNSMHDGRELHNADMWTNCLVRLPLFADLTNDMVDYISEKVIEFYQKW